MKDQKQIISDFFAVHKRAVLLWAVVIVSGGMLFKGAVQRPQINRYNDELKELNTKIAEERSRQAEIKDLETKVNTDEYIEKIASEKLGLVKSNAKIFIDVSDDN